MLQQLSAVTFADAHSDQVALTTRALQAILAKQRAETLSSVLYPDDRTYEGKELRLKQQHFFVSATLQDVVRRFKEANGDAWELFEDKVAFQLNDTHPTIAIPELMRILMDHHGLGWTQSWKITTKVRPDVVPLASSGVTRTQQSSVVHVDCSHTAPFWVFGAIRI